MTDFVFQLFPYFREGEWFRHSRGWVCATTLDRERDELQMTELVRSVVIVGANFYRCRGIERFAHSSPWHADERIGICVEGDDNGPTPVEPDV